MTKKIIAAAAVAAIVFALFHFIPISKKMDLKMDGSIRSADGEVIAPCSVELGGREQYYLFGKKVDALKGTLKLTGTSGTVTADVLLSIYTSPDKLPNGEDNPSKNIKKYSGFRYDGATNSMVTCDIYAAVDRSSYVLVDSGTIYCFSALAEAEFLEFFEQIKQHARHDHILNPAP